MIDFYGQIEEVKLEDFKGDWVLSSGDWELEYIEFRAKGKKPLVLHHPTLSALIFKLAGYMGVKIPAIEYAIQKFLLIDTPEPPTIEERFYAEVTMQGLERILGREKGAI